MKGRDEANEAEEGKDHAAVEVGVEGAHRAGAKTKQSAAQREVHLSIHAGNVASSERGTGWRTQ